MQDCNEIVTKVYNHPDVINLIQKIKPESIRDDLRQEIAVSLLEHPCEKVSALFAQDNLLRYAMRTAWLMVTSKKSQFYRKYRKSDIKQAQDYVYSLRPLTSIPISVATKAKQYLDRVPADKHEDHEIRIFNRFIELGSRRAVSRYYGIPIDHVCDVVKKVQKDIKCISFQ